LWVPSKAEFVHVAIATGGMGAGKGGRNGLGPLDYENFSKKMVVFLVSSGKKISPLLAPPLGKFGKNPLVVPPESKYINNTYNRAIEPLQKF